MRLLLPKQTPALTLNRDESSFFDLQEFRDANNPSEARRVPKLRKQRPHDLALLNIITEHRDLLVGAHPFQKPSNPRNELPARAKTIAIWWSKIINVCVRACVAFAGARVWSDCESDLSMAMQAFR